MGTASLVTCFPPSSPRVALKIFAPLIDFRLIILIGLTFPLLHSGCVINNMSPRSPLTTNHRSAHIRHPYNNVPPKSRPTPASSPTPPLQWKTLYSFEAIGSKKTFPFSVPQNWRFLWSCGNTEQDFYSLTIEVNKPDGSVVDPTAVITQCRQTTISALVQEHKGGMVYLNVDSDSGWTIQVQVPASTSANTPAARWKLQQTLHGTGNEKTSTFTVPKHWQMTWQCTLAGKNDIDILFANLNNTNGTVADPGAINGICKDGNTSDWTQEYEAGTYNLHVFSNTSWTIQLQIPQ